MTFNEFTEAVKEEVVYYLEDDGNLTECATTYHEENGSRYVLFETNHFSPYVMVEVSEKAEALDDTQQDATTESTQESDGTADTEANGNTESEGNGGDGFNPDFVLPIVILVVVILLILVGIVVKKMKE